MEVIVQLEDTIKHLDNVTKVNCFLAFDMFKNKIEIYQGETKTSFKQYEIIELKIEEDTEKRGKKGRQQE